MKIKTKDGSEINIYMSVEGLECCLDSCDYSIPHANACSKFNRHLHIHKRKLNKNTTSIEQCRAPECVEQYGTLSDILQLKPALPPVQMIKIKRPLKENKND